LHQTAQAHLRSSLLKVKSIAASTDLPDELRAGVPKPDLSEDERALLHNVTSGLYNREGVKAVIDAAIADVCEFLNVPVPGKDKKPSKEKKKQGEPQTEAEAAASGAENGAVTAAGEEEEVTDFEGFESDVDEPGPVVGEPGSEAEAEEEGDFSQYDHLLGSSSEDDDDESQDLSRWEKYRGTEKANLDDISDSGSDAERGIASFDEDESEDEQDEKPPSHSHSPEPKPKRQRAKVAKPTDSTFLPSLMGGYISGSESASDVDIEPPKKRRGQRARQAIWEKKFGAKAKHLNDTKKKSKGRDAGWDMKRGAVDGGDGRRRTPWKNGSNPFAGNDGAPRQEVKRPPPKRDDEGTLHPSWEARKKAKDSQKTVAFSGQKVVFD
jgi:hypothetical protein